MKQIKPKANTYHHVSGPSLRPCVLCFATLSGHHDIIAMQTYPLAQLCRHRILQNLQHWMQSASPSIHVLCMYVCNSTVRTLLSTCVEFSTSHSDFPSGCCLAKKGKKKKTYTVCQYMIIILTIHHSPFPAHAPHTRCCLSVSLVFFFIPHSLCFYFLFLFFIFFFPSFFLFFFVPKYVGTPKTGTVYALYIHLQQCRAIAGNGGRNHYGVWGEEVSIFFFGGGVIFVLDDNDAGLLPFSVRERRIG